LKKCVIFMISHPFWSESPAPGKGLKVSVQYGIPAEGQRHLPRGKRNRNTPVSMRAPANRNRAFRPNHWPI